MYPKDGPLTYLPTIYGFRVFGLKGSAYELEYDVSGVPKNKMEVEAVLKNKITGLTTPQK